AAIRRRREGGLFLRPLLPEDPASLAEEPARGRPELLLRSSHCARARLRRSFLSEGRLEDSAAASFRPATTSRVASKSSCSPACRSTRRVASSSDGSCPPKRRP